MAKNPMDLPTQADPIDWCCVLFVVLALVVGLITGIGIASLRAERHIQELKYMCESTFTKSYNNDRP